MNGERQRSQTDLLEGGEQSRIPNLGLITDKLLSIEMTTRPGAWNKSNDKALVETNQKQRELGIRYDAPSASLIQNFRIALAIIESKHGSSSKLPEGGSLCEIGGPTYGASKLDLFYSKADTAVYCNPSDKMITEGSLSMDDRERSLCSSDLSISTESAPVERLSTLATKYGKFDYITAYGVFGSESTGGFWDSDTGANLSSQEKRGHILREIASAMKENGLLLIELTHTPMKNPHNTYEEWGMTPEESKRYPMTLKHRGDEERPEPGFTLEELTHAGFAVISKRPYFNDCYVFQKASKRTV